MSEKILFVDDDTNILDAYKRQLRKEFNIATANSGELGLETLRSGGPYAVVVSDYQMPGMDGVEFLSRVRGIAPDTIRMMLTGHADLQTAMEAINDGHIFRFLTKPCKPYQLSMAIEAGIEQYELVKKKHDLAESRIVEETLRKTLDRLEQIMEERTMDLVRANERMKMEIEEREKAEKALRESKALLQVVLDNIPHGVCWKNRRSVYLGSNVNFARMAGVDRAEWIAGKSDYDLPWEEDFAESLHQYGERVMDTGAPEFNVMERMKNGSMAFWDTALIPFHDTDGKVMGVLGTFEDITERMWAEEERIKYERNKITLETAGNILVDLNRPLKIISECLTEDEISFDNLRRLRKEVGNILTATEKLREVTLPKTG